MFEAINSINLSVPTYNSDITKEEIKEMGFVTESDVNSMGFIREADVKAIVDIKYEEM